MKTYYLVYKITNLLNGKVYIGTHKTSNVNDDYMGSGKYLKNSQLKYGIENFHKEILFVFDDAKTMYAKEAEIVNEKFLTEKNNYNLKLGGSGGFDFINKKGKNLYGNNGKTPNVRHNFEKGLLTKQKIKNEDPEKWKSIYQKVAESLKGKPSGFLGKVHSDETKSKIGKKNSIKQQAEKNSQFGTKWIYSPIEQINKKIKKEDPIPDGWVKGRKIKKS